MATFAWPTKRSMAVWLSSTWLKLATLSFRNSCREMVELLGYGFPSKLLLATEPGHTQQILNLVWPLCAWNLVGAYTNCLGLYPFNMVEYVVSFGFLSGSNYLLPIKEISCQVVQLDREDWSISVTFLFSVSFCLRFVARKSLERKTC
jgi:hypothetical protein